MPSLGTGRSPTNGRFFYKTENQNAIIFAIVGAVFLIVNWVAFLLCWAGAFYMAFQQQSYSLDFNDATGNLDVKRVSTLTNSASDHKMIPYASAASASLNDAAGGKKIVVLNLVDGTVVPITDAEEANLAQTRCNLVNQHLNDAKSGVPAQQPQQQAPVMAQQQQPQPQQHVVYVDPQQQQQAPYPVDQQHVQQPYVPTV